MEHILPHLGCAYFIPLDPSDSRGWGSNTVLDNCNAGLQFLEAWGFGCGDDPTASRCLVRGALKPVEKLAFSSVGAFVPPCETAETSLEQ